MRFAQVCSWSVGWYVHNFLVAETNRLVEAEAGSLVLSSLACALLLVKLRLGLSDFLPAAKVIAAATEKCPGMSRCDRALLGRVNTEQVEWVGRCVSDTRCGRERERKAGLVLGLFSPGCFLCHAPHAFVASPKTMGAFASAPWTPSHPAHAPLVSSHTRSVLSRLPKVTRTSPASHHATQFGENRHMRSLRALTPAPRPRTPALPTPWSRPEAPAP